MTRSYLGRALNAPWYSVSVSRVLAVLCMAAALAFGVFLSTLLPYLASVPK